MPKTSPSFKGSRPFSQSVVKYMDRKISIDNSPAMILMPGILNDFCWPMKGSQGQVAISLSARITVHSIQIDYVPKHSAPDPSTSPRRVEVWGSFDRLQRSAVHKMANEHLTTLADPAPSGELGAKDNFFLLGQVNLNPRTQSSRWMTVGKKLRKMELKSESVIIRILDNWGSSTHTCLYGVRVFGQR